MVVALKKTKKSVKERRNAIIEKSFGKDKGRLKPFSEEDRS